MHASGVHTVTLPILNQLTDYALGDEGMLDPLLKARSEELVTKIV